MRIVMCTDAYWPRINGVTVSVDSFSRALIKAGHTVLVLCVMYPDNQTIERLSSNAIEKNNTADEPYVLRVPSYSLRLSKEDRLAKFHKWFWVSKQLDMFNPDIIHIHSEFVIGEFGLHYGKLNSIPLIYTFHTLWEEYVVNYIQHAPDFLLKFFARKLIKNMTKRVNTVIAPTEEISKVLKKYKVKKQIHLLPTGLDAQFFTNTEESVAEFRKKMDIKFPNIKNKKILLFAGRVSKEKNISFLFKSLSSLLLERDDLILFIAGSGPDMEFFQEEVKTYGIQKNCIFSGYFERKDLTLLYAMSYLFVFPSLTETQGLVTIEAMLSGIPVVAIGERGTKTVMGGDNGGFMVKNDPFEFCEKVRLLLQDSTLYQQKKQEAIEHAQKWTIDSLAEKLQEIYYETYEKYKNKK